MKELDLEYKELGERPDIEVLKGQGESKEVSPIKRILMGAGIFGETLNVVSAKIEAEFVRRISEAAPQLPED